MPLPLSYFNNELDPTLPSEIKPILYRYDEYQTYDIVICSDIYSYLQYVIADYFGINRAKVPYAIPFNSWASIISEGYCLIERFTPFDIDWCSGYSLQLYELFKLFAGSNINSYLQGSGHPKQGFYDFGTQLLPRSHDFNPIELILNIPGSNDSEDIIISWLEYGLINPSSPEYIKRYEVIKTTNELSTITLNFNHIQPCSMVVYCSNNSLKNSIISQISDCYLYSKFTDVAHDLFNKINQYYPKINHVLIRVSFNGNIRLSEGDAEIIGDFDLIQDSDFVIIPEESRSHGLIYANNNVWNNETKELNDINFLHYYYFYVSSLKYKSFNRFTEFYYDCYQFFDLIPLTFKVADFPYGWVKHEFKYPLLWGNPGFGSPPYYNNPSNYFEYSGYFDYLKNYLGHPGWDKFVPYFGHFRSPVILVNHSELDINNRQLTKLLIGKGVLDITGLNVELEAYDITTYNIDKGSFVHIPISLIWEFDNVAREFEFTPTITPQEYVNISDNDHYYEVSRTGEKSMPDSIRLKEIHNALLAQKFGEQDRVANLGYYIERIARILGVSVNPDGSVRSIRQSKHIKQGDEIPAGWSIGQWGRNQGGDNDGQKGGSGNEDRDGLAYEVRTNKFTTNMFTGQADKIEQGGYVLVENLPQLLHIILDDFDKALGMAEAGANVLPSPNNSKPIPYEGINTLLAEIAYMLSQLSRNITGTHINSLKNQGMLMELIAAHGTPSALRTIKIDLGIEDDAELSYPGVEGMTNYQMTTWILSQLAFILGASLKEIPPPPESPTPEIIMM